MRYTGMTCEACKKVFEETDDVVCCPVCGAPEHRSCWLENGHCANEAKHAEGYSWKMPEQFKPVVREEKSETEEGNVRFPDGTHSVTCPHCGAENFPDDIYCRACHEPIKKEGLFDISSERYTQDDAPQDNRYAQNPENPRQNIYNAYSLYGGLSPDSEIEGIPVKEYAEYIGTNSGSYIRKFSIAEHFRKKTIWNWAAAVFGPIWFLGRKQTKIGAIMCAVIIALSALAGVLSASDAVLQYIRVTYSAMQTKSAEYAAGEITYEQMLEQVNNVAAKAKAELDATENSPRDIASVVIEYLILTATVVFSGLYGNYCYKTKVKKEILDSREKCTTAESYRAMLMSRGGFSVGHTIIGVLLQAVSWACLTLIPLLYVVIIG